jgi:hypothetical protein
MGFVPDSGLGGGLICMMSGEIRRCSRESKTCRAADVRPGFKSQDRRHLGFRSALYEELIQEWEQDLAAEEKRGIAAESQRAHSVSGPATLQRQSRRKDRRFALTRPFARAN